MDTQGYLKPKPLLCGSKDLNQRVLTQKHGFLFVWDFFFVWFGFSFLFFFSF